MNKLIKGLQLTEEQVNTIVEALREVLTNETAPAPVILDPLPASCTGDFDSIWTRNGYM